MVISLRGEKMNKKAAATTEKIYEAFKNVLCKKEYNEIRIQDVLDASKVARSTFYAHYKTKEDLLKSICTTIFGHVFSHTLEEEKSHDFSKSSIFDYKHFITHIFYHLRDERELITAIFGSQSKDVFLEFLRQSLEIFAVACVENNFVRNKELPERLKIDAVVENFILIIKYWIGTDFSETPERLTEYCITINT